MLYKVACAGFARETGYLPHSYGLSLVLAITKSVKMMGLLSITCLISMDEFLSHHRLLWVVYFHLHICTLPILTTLTFCWGMMASLFSETVFVPALLSFFPVYSFAGSSVLPFTILELISSGMLSVMPSTTHLIYREAVV